MRRSGRDVLRPGPEIHLPAGVGDCVWKILRAALDKTFNDPDFKADAEKSRIDISPSSGEKVQALVTSIFATSPEVVERAKRIIRLRDGIVAN